MTAIAARAVLQEKRRSRRWDVQVPLQMRGLGSGPAASIVTDLSPFGCRIESERPYHVDARLNLTLPGLTAIDATVVWCEDRTMGLAFDHPLHEAVADHLVRSYPVARSDSDTASQSGNGRSARSSTRR